MSQYSFALILIVFLIFNVLDKGITMYSLSQIKKNFPNADPLKAEKNPLQRWLFKHQGLTNGALLYGAIATVWMLLLFYGIGYFSPASMPFILWGFFGMFGFTIFNNLYFLLKYSRMIP